MQRCLVERGQVRLPRQHRLALRDTIRLRRDGRLLLHDALRVMEDSEFVASVLGEHVFDAFLRHKRQEWDDYRVEVTPYELRRYLSAL